MKNTIGILFVLALILAPYFYFTHIQTPPSYSPTPQQIQAHKTYQEGVNDALEAVALLSLEQSYQKINRPWNEMIDIVCARLQVKRTIP